MATVFSKKEKRWLAHYDFYFFNSPSFRKYFSDMDCYLLSVNYRQNDTAYAEIIKKIGMGSIDDSDLEMINRQVRSPSLLPEANPIITPSRNGVSFFNRVGLKNHDELFCQAPVYDTVLPGFSEVEHDCRDITENLSYAVNVPVIFTQKDRNGRWVNGTRGIIKSCGQTSNGSRTLQISTKNRMVESELTAHRIQRFIYNGKTGQISNECVAIIRQFPFILGFAMTVHKCQGMTLEAMAFNPGSGCFAPGQLYVALSRVKTQNDLTLHAEIDEKEIIISPYVRS
jgi:hypothetical protein